jgi:hypothetical protein
MEKMFGLAIRDVQGVEENMMHVMTKDEGNDTFLRIWNDENSSELLVESWRKSQISRELERLLSTPEAPGQIGKRRRTEPEFVGTLGNETQPWTEKASMQVEGYQDSAIMNSPIVPAFQDHGRFISDAYESILNPIRLTIVNKPSTLDFPDLPSETWHLLDVYFSYTHAWFPIMEKQDLLRTSYQYAQSIDDISLTGPGSGNHAALWAAIAYAKFQHRAINNIPHAQGNVADAVWTAERMYTQARKLIPAEEGYFEIGHVQALLILALANLGIGFPSRAWILVGQAVRIAFDLRLHRASEDIMAALQRKSRKTHVFLGCFLLDTMIAARLGHRPHLRADDVDVLGLLEVDGLEELEWTDCLSVRRHSGNFRGPSSILSTFNGLIQVTQILNEATCIADNPKRSQLSTVLLEKLHLWSQSQKASLYFDSNAMKSDPTIAFLPHHYNLHLAYFNTLAISQLLSYGHGQNSTLNLEPSARSARQIVELFKQHSRSFGLLIVPPTFESFAKTAYDIIHEINTSLSNTYMMSNDWKHNLDSCIDAMELAWPVFEPLKISESFRSDSAVASHGRRHSQVAYDLISGINQSSERNAVGQTPGSVTDYDTSSPRTTRSQQGPISINTPPANHIAPSPVSQLLTSFGQSTGQPFRSNFQRGTQQTSKSTQAGRTQPPSQLLSQRSGQNISSECELDPTFQEFATLDATKWYVVHFTMVLLQVSPPLTYIFSQDK